MEILAKTGLCPLCPGYNHRCDYGRGLQESCARTVGPHCGNDRRGRDVSSHGSPLCCLYADSYLCRRRQCTYLFAIMLTKASPDGDESSPNSLRNTLNALVAMLAPGVILSVVILRYPPESFPRPTDVGAFNLGEGCLECICFPLNSYPLFSLWQWRCRPGGLAEMGQ